MASNKSYKEVLLSEAEEYEKLFLSIIQGYEDLLKVDKGVSIRHNIRKVITYLKESKIDINQVHKESKDLDTALTVAITYSEILGKELLEREALQKALGDSNLLLRTLSSLKTYSVVSKDEVVKFALNFEETLDHESLEYRTLRVLCLAKCIDIIMCVCLISKLIYNAINYKYL